jgi:hypothetical protein
MSTGVSRRPAELREGVRNVRTISAGVAVHGGCVAAGTDSTRIHHAGMKRPAVGAAVRERRSENAGQRTLVRERWSENAGQRRGTASEGSRPDAGRDGSQACTRERSRASAAMLTAFAHRPLQSDMTREPSLNMGFTIKLIGGWPRIRQSLYRTISQLACLFYRSGVMLRSQNSSESQLPHATFPPMMALELIAGSHTAVHGTELEDIEWSGRIVSRLTRMSVTERPVSRGLV